MVCSRPNGLRGRRFFQGRRALSRIRLLLLLRDGQHLVAASLIGVRIAVRGRSRRLFARGASFFSKPARKHPENGRGTWMRIVRGMCGWRAGTCAVTLGALLVSTVAFAEQKGEWTMTGRTYDLQRFSPLDQIKPSNVAGLV